jgi:DNA-3-methyladenine glycosylase
MGLPQSFYERDTVAVARDLLGCLLINRDKDGAAAGRIVEVEAYLRDDPAAHSYRGMTERNRAMFGPAGHAYVYRIYGLHTCVNAVTGAEGRGEAVLIRALEPVAGIDLMQARRGRDDLISLANGPGKLTEALGITTDLDGTSLSCGPLRIYPPTARREEIVQTTRVGITKAADLPLRFCLKGNPYLSRR